ncbi:MAG: CCA tRNA nucleotidyltransferase [Candidatus Coprovivens sp.]
MDTVIPKPVNEALTLLYDKDFEGYIVGGTVRNMVMGQKPKVYDISTDATMTDIKKIYKNYQTYLTGENNKTLAIVNPKFPMKVTQYRTPENTLEADLATRDFTMNALAFSDEDGLIDYSTGLLDINNKIIRINGDDDTIFQEDPLKIIRAIRLSAEYLMKIDRQTIEYMFDDKELLKNVAPERIRDEISKLLVTRRADFYIKKYFEIFLEIIPELALLEGFNTNDPHHIYDALEHTILAMKNSDSTLELRLALLFHDVSKPFTGNKKADGTTEYKDHAKKSAEMAREILNRLRFSKKIIQKVVKLVEYHEYTIPEKDIKIKEFLSKFGSEDIEDLFKLKRANFYAKNPAYASEIDKIEEEYERVKGQMKKNVFIKKNEMKIDGHDLVNIGLEQEEVGIVLNEIYQKVISGELKNNRDKLISYVINNVLPKEDKSEVIFKKVA